MSPILAALAVIMALHTAALAQAPDATVAPADVIARVRARYRAGPVCERMRIEVRADSGRVARSWVVARMDGRKALLLDLGTLRIAADDRSVTAVHERNPQTCFSTTLPGTGELTLERLWQVIPPVPLPQFDLAWAEDAERLESFGVYARSVRWERAEREQRSSVGGPQRVLVTGVCDRGKVVLMVRGDQLQQVDIRDDVQQATIRIQISPVLPCRAEEMRLKVEDRTAVAALSDLQPRSGVLRIGAAVPEMQLSTAAGQVQRLKDLYTPPAEYLPAPPADRLVLVFSRMGRDPLAGPAKWARVEGDVLGRELARLQREIYTATASPPLTGERPAERDAGLLPAFNFAEVMVLEAPPAADALLALIKRERDAWGDHLAWTTNAAASVDLFATGGESLVIVLDGSQRLRSVIPIGDHATTESVLDQITASLIERAGE